MVTRILIFSLVGAIIFPFSACTLFQDARRDSALKDGEVQKFIGSIRPRREDAASHYALGCHLQERKKHRPAIEEFKAAVELKPGNVQAYNAMGISYDALGEYQSAVESYTMALWIDPKQDDVLNNLGYSYLMQGKLDLAVEHFQKALELNGTNARYRNNLGLALAKGGRYDDALAAFKAGGDESKAHYNIAQLYFQAGRYRESELHFAQAARLGSSDPQAGTGVKAAAALKEILSANDTASLAVAAQEPGSAQRYKAPQTVSERASLDPPASARSVPVPEMRQVVRRMLEGDAATPLAAASSPLNLKAAEPQERAARIRIEVSNGNGVRGAAKRVGRFLKEDFALMYISNARHFNFKETTIYYAAGYRRDADRIARRLPGRQKLEEVPEIRAGNAQINILIGRDLVPHVNLFSKV